MTTETKAWTDSERLDWLEHIEREGASPALLNDDNGHWAITCDGTQSLPDSEEPADIWTSFVVEKGQWHNSIREAIDAYKAEWDADA